MREFTRVALRFLMIVFLFAGCGYNIYFIQKLGNNNSPYSRSLNRYSVKSSTQYEPCEDDFADVTNVDTTQYNNYQ